MNYNIIKNEVLLKYFIDWLPELLPEETYYISLHARAKYLESIKKDIILERVICSKENMFNTIKRFEIELGTYTIPIGKDHYEIPEESLVVYITVNPRSLKKASFEIVKQVVDNIYKDNFNVLNTTLTEIHKSTGTKHFFHIDYDYYSQEEIISVLENNINMDCVNLIKTRKGFHVIIRLKAINTQYKASWYKAVVNSTLVVPDKHDSKEKDDNLLLPIPGTTQGGFMPIML